MHQFFRGNFFNFEAVRILGTARYGGAEVAEFLEATAQIKENDPETWSTAWSKMAEKAEGIALEAQRSGHVGAARDAFLRASNYTRASAYMMTGDSMGESDSRVVSTLNRATALFGSALSLFDNEVHVLQIPYEDGLVLPAYLYLPPPARRLPGGTPILVNCIGADSVQEEIYYMFPAVGPDLGYAVLTFEGPGQGLMLHQHNLPMRPDWETVNEAVIQYIHRYANDNKDLGLDLGCLAISGASLGGYFALRSAADPRYKACVAIDPVYDLWNFAAKHSGPLFFGLWRGGWIPDWFMNMTIRTGTRLFFQMRWEIYTSARFLGVSSGVEILRAMQKFTLQQPHGHSYLSKVKCPVFVTGAADALYTDVQDHTSLVFDQSQHPEKEKWVATTPGEGSLQAKMGALGLCNQRAFQFLDRQFHIKRD